LDQVTLVLDGRRILDDVTVTFPGTGITVLVGPSGSGKTMLLRLLNRLEVPTSGTVLFRGQPVASLDPLELRRRVGMVFQRATVFPGTVRDNLAVARPAAGGADMRRVLGDAGLGADMLDRVADDLSGGEAQRLCLARTLATEPEALLMDEPTSALDPEARHHLEHTARRLARRGMPIVWVTHDLRQADRLGDHRVVLVGGRIADAAQAARFLTDDLDGGRHRDRPEHDHRSEGHHTHDRPPTGSGEDADGAR
jgi:putative ABC transport system ATP-binding protein